MSDFYRLTETALDANESSRSRQVKQIVRDLGGMSDREVFTVTCQGTWDGATVNVEHSVDDGTTWIADSNLEFTSDGSKVCELSRYALVRATMSSAGTSSVHVYIG